MCRIFKFLTVLAVLGFLASPAFAWNIKQKSDGTYWENQSAGKVTEYHVLRTYLTVEMSDVLKQATSFVVSPIAGFVEKIYTTLHGAIATTQITWQFWISNSLTNFHVTSASAEITNGTARHTAGGVALAGGTSAFTTRAATTANGRGWWPNENVVIEGGLISIQSSGQSLATTTANTPGSVTIVINPKNR